MNVPKLRFKEFTDEWSFTSFNEIFSILNGYAFSSKDFISSQEIILTKIANVDFNCMSKDNLSFLPKEYLNKYSKFMLNRNDIVIALTRPILNNNLKIAIVDDFFDKSLLNQRVGKIISKHNSLFVYYMLQTKKCIHSINISIAGTDPPNLSPEKITYIKKYLPQSKEQNKIANFLTTVDKKITNLENTITSLENQKKGLLQQIFSQKLRFKDKNGNNYPNWKKKKLSELIIIKTGISPTHILDENGSIPYFKVEQLNNSNKYQINTPYKTKNNKKLIPPKSIIFPKRGISILSNKIRILSQYSLIDTNIMALIIKNDSISNEFLYYFLLNEDLSKIADTTSIPQINNKHIEPYVIYLPCLEEQTKIADFLSTFDRKLENQKVQLEHWKQIKKGLLQQMFV